MTCEDLWVVSFAPRPLYPQGKSPQKAGWVPEAIWTLWRREKLFVGAGN
jgi:hypothetical protein